MIITFGVSGAIGIYQRPVYDSPLDSAGGGRVIN